MDKIRLGDIATLINGDRGKNYPSQADITEEGDIPFVNAGHLNGRSIDFEEMNYISQDKFNRLSSGKFIKGDVLYCLRGSLGKKAIVNDDVEGAIASSLVIIRPDYNRIDGDYLMFSLDSPSIKEQLIKANNGSSQPNLSAASVREYRVELPDMKVQKDVVNKLAKVRAIIDSRQHEIDLLDDLIKARFVEMFGTGYPEDTLINLCNIIDYRGKTPEKVESGLPFITAKNIKMHQMNMEPREYISKETYDKVMVRGFPKEGDVVFTTEAPLGNVCRIPHFDTEFYIGQRIVTMQTEKLIPTYLEYALSTDEFKRKYMGQSSGSTVTGIRVRLLEQLTISVPPMTLQRQFESFVNQVDKSKVAVQKALDEAQLLFDSLMQEYFG